ncbi:MAG: hypothetical protein ACYDH5_03585 [Acidimicrobiales bacterium]
MIANISVLQAEFSLTQVLDAPLAGRVFFEEVIRESLDAGRPDQVSLIFDRKVVTRGKRPTPSRFRTPVLTQGVTPSIHVGYKHSKIKQYFKLGHAIRTEATIGDASDFGIGRRLHNLPALAAVGFNANRRLQDAQRAACDPIAGADAYDNVCSPVVVRGQRVPALRFDNPMTQALLTALVVFTANPGGFSNGELRELLAPLLGTSRASMTPGRMTYHLRRLRLHGLIERTPHTFRYHVTDQGLRSALVLTRAHDRFLYPASLVAVCRAACNGTQAPAPGRLRRAARRGNAGVTLTPGGPSSARDACCRLAKPGAAATYARAASTILPPWRHLQTLPVGHGTSG